MPFVRLAFFPSGTAEHHAALATALQGVPAPPARLAFLAGPRDGGWQVVQVWRDREGLDAFNQAHFLPALSALADGGFPEPPVVHDFVTTESWFARDGGPEA